ncbi:hypothetical protein AR457_05700 [Streptomyces agglomeratus]|uniref:BON domain-containing protein n=1 Tax=Streptomyces agglomeratus TaxID=285458 RepID=A0A1E5P396_9ACTN|nr:hypothetical protein [Streptomyces agglomeratus]OEJ24033.1 hypothetical protein AS594_05630 [Streptomyces agglomeratus]OEJ41962.1 hypothetical protein BGK70_30940 [Streptomyces agglomeratus]OEJ43660.1 hypothetical protein AR457_05700 [Streptomyces agglomeratus]OEJ54453.1 hypothetical protein BGK72_30255 [Streptomyces agglomeratus]OEJ61823.1 hypothetical protein BGM19_31160 [Streptomyces agglomeratus]
MNDTSAVEYRIAHLQEHLASGDYAEMGVRIELRGNSVLIAGTVSSAACRDEILRMAEDELAGLPLHEDLVVVSATAPDHPEELA